MLKELMATVGIGSAKVKLAVENPQVEIGKTMRGIIQIKGGKVEQIVKKIYINLVLTSSYESGGNVRHIKRTIWTVSVAEKLILKSGENVSVPFRLKIPLYVPVTKGSTKYCLVTGLDIERTVNPRVSIAVTILPNRYMKMAFEAFSTLGFEEKIGFGNYNGNYQEFEFRQIKFMAPELSINVHLDSLGLVGSSSYNGEIGAGAAWFRLPYKQMISTYQVTDKLREIIKRQYRACS